MIHYSMGNKIVSRNIGFQYCAALLSGNISTSATLGYVDATTHGFYWDLVYINGHTTKIQRVRILENTVLVYTL